MEISSLKELTNKLPDGANYDITTTLSVDSLNSKDLQKITNKILEHSKRESIKTSDYDNEIILKKASKENLKDADSVLGNINIFGTQTRHQVVLVRGIQTVNQKSLG